jgi:MFS family permease
MIALSRVLRRHLPGLARLSGAELAIAVMFLTNGLILGSWIVRIPAITERIDVSTGTFGLILPAGAVGAMAALPMAGRLCGQYGSARMVTLFSLGRTAIVPLALLVPNPLWFAFGVAAYGFANGAMDIALNAQGVEVERARHRAILSSLHGCSSFGSLIGAIVGGLAAGLGIGVLPQMTGTCVLVVALTLWLARHHINDEQIAIPSLTVQKRRLIQLPPAILVPFGLIAFCGALSEGGVGDWSSLYIRNELDVSASRAAWGYTAFAMCMLVGRFSGDAIIRRLGQERALRLASLVGGAGLLIVSAIGTLWSAYLGFAITGLGVSIIIPIAYRMAGSTAGIPRARAVASTALIGYLGFLLGPLVLGTIGDLAAIRVSLLAIGGVLLLIQIFVNLIASKPSAVAPAALVTRETPAA